MKNRSLKNRITAGVRSKNLVKPLTKKEIEDYVLEKIEEHSEVLKDKPIKVCGPIEIFYRALSAYQEKNRAHPRFCVMPFLLFGDLSDQLQGVKDWEQHIHKNLPPRIAGVAIYYSPTIKTIELGR